jgi:hypothetical protein
MKERHVSFEVSDRGEVSGVLVRPPRATALYVFGHGAGAGMRHPFMQAVAARLDARKIATLRYMFPYTEAGRRRPDPRPTLIATVRAAIATARTAARGLPLVAGGKSMGGRMTSMAAAARPLPGVVGLVFLGFPLHAPGKRGTERADHLADVQCPMLFCQGTRDKLADLELLRPVIAGLGQRASLHVVEGGDHSLNVPKRSGRTGDEVLDEVSDHVAATVRRWTS